jgi:predicted transcriptional regulator of viral defense system
MRRKELQLLEHSPCFTKAALRQLHGASGASLDKDIQNWIKKGLLIPLKRGLYTLDDFVKRERQPELFSEYVANKLVQPSYLSCEYVLQKHSLMTESILSVTSVTIKSTRSFQNKLGHFRYYSISSALFTGMVSKPYSGNTILEATKAKALFDYLYLRQHLFPSVSQSAIAGLRLNLEELTAADWRELRTYVDLCGTKKMTQVFEALKRSAAEE